MPTGPRSHSTALPEVEAAQTRLGRSLAAELQNRPGLSGIHPLVDARDAFAARVLLASAAERTLDVQYYIWRRDTTGILLLEALHEAADRNVRVRLLVDDSGTSGLDEELRALDTHPMIEVRLFNPFRVRSPKWLGYLTDFARANRRMHNKSFIVDNQAAIVGGRNVGDEYFGATEDILFADLDVLAIGPIVQDTSRDFDRYWASESAVPAEQVLPPVSPERLSELARSARGASRDPRAAAYVGALRELAFIRQLIDGELAMEWAPTRIVSDDPAKGLARAGTDGLLIHQLGDVLGAPASRVDLVSPYFVPTGAGVDYFSALTRRGVQVRILTNALEATDVAVVHAGYAKRRRSLLAAGAKLFEMRREIASERRTQSPGPFGSSGSSLHAKTFSVDRSRIFVGSFNFDPRSAHLNTELGFVIDSPALAARIADLFNDTVPAFSYEVRLDERGRLSWLERGSAGDPVRHSVEPNSTFLGRLALLLASMLPIEWML